ncbi:MAG: NAD-dependent DNA ligase LigA [Myxococcota bacterium]|nr:NAD-dependent DNA ligase LigA [Myxococcota bacterium]
MSEKRPVSTKKERTQGSIQRALFLEAAPLPEGWTSWDEPQLSAELARHNQLYWDQATPEISDYDYDRLVEALRTLNPSAPILNALGPTVAAVGAPVTHRRPMLSLEKCYDEEGLLRWADKGEGPFLCSPKVDGVACSLRYGPKGRLLLATTRGDGKQGEDITQNVQPMETIPARIPAQGVEVEIRGEIYMPLSAFARCDDEFANPRNATAGTLKQKTRQRAGELGLSFFAYDVDGLALATLSEALAEVERWGFSPVPSEAMGRDELQQAYEVYVARRAELDYEIDGVCFRIDDRARYFERGETIHHPRGAIAYKLQGESATTVLRSVEWGVSRNRLLTPVGVVDPVRLSGAVVSRISLHNWGLVQSKGLSIGAEVVAMRRGGVIPHLEAVSRPGDQPIEAPSQCPQCPHLQAPTRVDGDQLFCAYEGRCEAQAASVLSHFVRQMGIEGFGVVWLETLTEAGILKSPADLYRLDKAALLELPRVGEVRAQGWIDSVEARRRVPLATFLAALGVPELGQRAAESLSEAFQSLPMLLAASVDEIAELPNFAEKTATLIRNGLAARADLINALCKEIELIKVDEQPQDQGEGEGELYGLRLLFTGTLAAMKRSEAERRAKALGAEIASGVSKTLSALIVGDEGRAGSKLKKAQAIGCEIWTESMFLDRLTRAKVTESEGSAPEQEL